MSVDGEEPPVTNENEEVDASEASLESNENFSTDESPDKSRQPSWLLKSPFLLEDDESEEGILDAGGKDGSDRYVTLAPSWTPQPRGGIHGSLEHILSEDQQKEVAAEFEALWSLWNPAERKRFRKAVKRLGKLQPRLISKRVGTKTPEQVSRILFYLETLAIDLRPYKQKKIKEAYEVSDEKIEKEMKRAEKLLRQEKRQFKAGAESEDSSSSDNEKETLANAAKFLVNPTFQALMDKKTQLPSRSRDYAIKSLKMFLRRAIFLSAHAALERSKNTHPSRSRPQLEGDEQKVDLGGDIVADDLPESRHQQPENSPGTRVIVAGEDIQYALHHLVSSDFTIDYRRSKPPARPAATAESLEQQDDEKSSDSQPVTQQETQPATPKSHSRPKRSAASKQILKEDDEETKPPARKRQKRS